jgi:hypothetical protein
MGLSKLVYRAVAVAAPAWPPAWHNFAPASSSVVVVVFGCVIFSSLK